MLLFTTIFSLITIFASFAISANSCRQCAGSVSVKFLSRQDAGRATAWILQTIGDCTGKDLELSNRQVTDCDPVKTTLCSTYTYHLQAWRFCSNGGSAIFNKNHKVNFSGNTVDTTMLYNLQCDHSVECKGHPCASCF